MPSSIPQAFFGTLHPLRAGIVSCLAGLVLVGVPAVHAQQAPASAASAVSSAGGVLVSPADRTPVERFAQRRPQAARGASPGKAAYTPIPTPASDEGLIPEIEMFVGESRVFPTPGVARIAVGNGGILNAAALDNKEVILFANGVGTSSLFVWNQDGRYQRVKINIVPGDTSRYAREIAAFLTAIPKAKAAVIGDKVIVEGDNLSDSDLLKISKLAERYPQIINFTNTVGWEQMVMMDVKVVEFPTSALRDIGLKWGATGGAAVGAIWSPAHRGSDGPYQIDIRTGSENAPPITAPGGTGPVFLPPGLNVLSALNVGLNAQLSLLEQQGKATVLAEPQLSARNGAQASFLAGGEIPYALSNANGTTIQFKPYGIKLNIEPHVDRNGVVRAKFEAEVSAVDPSIAGTLGGPALTTRRTKTEFNVHAGETFVLSGLLQRSQSTDIDKVPLLGDIPVLGELFRSRRFQNKETELVIFVTPTVVDARSPGMVDRIEKTRERLRENLGDKPHLTEPLQPGQDPALIGQALPSSATEKQGGESPTLEAAAGGGGTLLHVITDGLPLYAQPSVQSTPLLQLGIGGSVRLGEGGTRTQAGVTWRSVTVGGLQGWVRADGVTPRARDIPPAAGSAFARADQAGQFVAMQPPTGRTERPGALTLSHSAPDAALPFQKAAVAQLAMRVTPDVNAPVVLQLRKGEIVKRLTEPPQGYWVAVEARGERGWVASQWLVPLDAQESAR